ncbi:hypothetical protein GCM10022200_05880 [Microbacterium awajiense]|uniref:DUF4233 domain-containing protein n=1 Tax=Microbacterium awajiense TaxID=415214 RepID=A0ABP7A7E2_9MICO
MMDAAAAARSPRRRRGAAESLGAIVLGFESVVVFLGGLTVFGLRATPDGVEPWWGIVAGSVLAVLMILVAGRLRHRWALVLGWILQAIVLAGGFAVPALFLVGLIFGGLWAYATIKGASLDAHNAQRAADSGNGD